MMEVRAVEDRLLCLLVAGETSSHKRHVAGFAICAEVSEAPALIVQEAVAHNEDLGANWKARREFWADRATNESALRTNLLSLAATRPNVERSDPDLWTDKCYFLDQLGQAEMIFFRRERSP